MMIRILHLSGDYSTLGRQHGEQVADLRPQIQAAMEARLTSLRRMGIDTREETKKIIRVWEQHASGTLEMLNGIAQALDLDWDDYFSYTVSSYMADLHDRSLLSYGCSTWAAGPDCTLDGAPLLVKNRDYRPDHQLLQCLALVFPSHGNAYLCLTSAGSPGVFSSGINSAGLAVVDTHVASTDTGPGIARYSFMMDLLEKFSQVGEAAQYLYSLPHFGDGTVTLADALGNLAVFEIAHTRQAIRWPVSGYVVSTNHFTEPGLDEHWLDTQPPHLKGNSLGRRQKIESALQSACGSVDISWSQALMAYHENPITSICRHPAHDRSSITISSSIFLPQNAGLWLSNGHPCQVPFEFYEVIRNGGN